MVPSLLGVVPLDAPEPVVVGALAAGRFVFDAVVALSFLLTSIKIPKTTANAAIAPIIQPA